MKGIIILMILFVLPLPLLCETEAKVISKAGQWLTIDKGKKDGIEVGFTGIVKTFISESGKKIPFNIGLFKVEKVMEDKAELNIIEIGKGFEVEQAEFVVFKNDIKPLLLNRNIPAQISKQVPEEITKSKDQIPGGHPIDWYLERGDKYFEEKNFKDAKGYYKKIIEINPQEPVVQRKLKQCDDNEAYYAYVKRGENYFLKSDFYSALEYYLEAWKIMPAQSVEVLKKIIETSAASNSDWLRFKDMRSNDLQTTFESTEKYMENEKLGTRLTFYLFINKILPERKKQNSDKLVELASSYKDNWETFVKDYQADISVYFDDADRSLKEGNVELAVDCLFYAYRLLPMQKEEVAKKLAVISAFYGSEWEKCKQKYSNELGEYLSAARVFYNAGDIDSALRYYVYGYKFFPSRAEEISQVLLEITKTHTEKWQRFASEHLETLKKYIDQADEFLAKNELNKALEFYYTAYRLLPSQEKILSDRFKKISELDINLWEKFEKENFEGLKPLLLNEFYPFLTKVKDKAEAINRGKWGYWEATFPHGSEMIYIPEGEFFMGSDSLAVGIKPKHKVYLDGFWMAKYEVTFEQYDAFCQDTNREKADDKGWGRGKLPVINVSWFDAVAYTQWLSQKTGLNFRLAYEAEWEKAARGTDERIFPWGNIRAGEERLNSAGEKKYKYTAPVGSFPDGVSPYGLLDMAGNVCEWVMDWYDENYYAISPTQNPQGPQVGSNRVLRGGSWDNDVYGCSTYARGSKAPKSKFKEGGFRVCVDTKQ